MTDALFDQIKLIAAASAAPHIEEGLRKRIERLEEQRRALLEMIDFALIGGNHLGTHKQPYWPPPDTNRDDAMTVLVGNFGVKEYDIWCCWAQLMKTAEMYRSALAKARAQ